MEFVPTRIEGAYEIRLDVRADDRGRFKRQYCEREFARAGLNISYVQVNHSITLGEGSLRGLHFQRPPAAEVKLVSCAVGKVFDVAVDLRQDSPSFLQWVSLILDESRMFYIPAGCAHGFQTLAPEAHLIYMHSEYYASEHEGGLRYDDPRLAIAWPLPVGAMSERDRSFALLDHSFQGLHP